MSGDAPDFVEVLEQVLQSRVSEIRTWFPGRVLAFNRTSKRANIEPLVLLDGDQRLPVLRDIRVAWPGGVVWDLETGATAGETGIVLVGWRSWGQWARTGDPSVPEDEGLHEDSYATFLPGLGDDAFARSIDLSAGAKVVTGSDIRLGSNSANKAVMHEGAATALKTWASAVSGAITGLGGDVTAALATFSLAIDAAVSPTSKVEA